MTKTQINNKEANIQLVKSTAKAELLIQDKEKTQIQIRKAFKKANRNKSKLESVWHQLQLFFSIIRDYYTGDYKEIPINALVAIVASLLYLLSPIDLIPDFIPLLGFIDDIAVIGLVITQISSCLNTYETWKKKQ
jgi:uncharacterized membrane protein YkvA (DUF1232 family)